MVSRASSFARTIAVTLTAIIVAGPAGRRAVEGAGRSRRVTLGRHRSDRRRRVRRRPLRGATPVTVSRILPAGEHRVRVVKSGYLENARLITVVAGKPTASR
jgi:hypothetical protein